MARAGMPLARWEPGDPNMKFALKLAGRGISGRVVVPHTMEPTAIMVMSGGMHLNAERARARAAAGHVLPPHTPTKLAHPYPSP
jgi:hypothetical protein